MCGGYIFTQTNSLSNNSRTTDKFTDNTCIRLMPHACIVKSHVHCVLFLRQFIILIKNLITEGCLVLVTTNTYNIFSLFSLKSVDYFSFKLSTSTCTNNTFLQEASTCDNIISGLISFTKELFKLVVDFTRQTFSMPNVFDRCIKRKYVTCCSQFICVGCSTHFF